MSERSNDGNPRALSTVLVGLLSVLILVVMIQLLELGYYRLNAQEVESKQGRARAEAMTRLRAEQEAKLEVSGPLDAEKGTHAIPIEEAMARIVAEQSGDSQ